MPSDVILSGSHRDHPADAAFLGKPPADEILQITCILRRRDDAPKMPVGRLSHQQFERIQGADPSDIDAVERFANEHGFCVVRIDSAARAITLAGKFSALAGAFGADVDILRLNEQTFRSRQGDLHLHPSLDGRVVAVFGFDQRPVAATRHRMLSRTEQQTPAYTPLQVAQAYNFPSNKGANQTIALIELGGGFNNADLTTYWRQLSLPTVSVTAVGVDGAINNPSGDPASADGEVTLDIEVAGAIAPAARIAVYFAPNTDQGFYDAISAAIHDKTRKPSVISISWGMPENAWTPQALNAFNALFHDAALLGISVCAASGDNGASDGESGGTDHVDFPASSPWVLACGGTRMTLADGKITSETVWNDGSRGGATGGGVSVHFSEPSYQSSAKVPKPVSGNPTGRGVPDVAGNADPESGYVVLIDGEEGVVGGTSAVAPLWAALIALLNERLGKRVGWLHPKLYGTLATNKALHDIIVGNNSGYQAQPGWDPCTGLGTPDGAAILNLLR